MMAFDLSTMYMLVGFLLAAYAVVANDSVQTLGTFIASQKSRVKWYWLWLAASVVLVLTLGMGWYENGGDIAHGRLDKIPRPEVFEWYHMVAPLGLLFLTRFGLPVSTTFLVLSVFASDVVLEKMVLKSMMGYAVAAAAAFVIWFLISRLLNEHKKVTNPKEEKFWRIAQWFATGFLWSSWLAHDMANIAVYLPRELSVTEFVLTVSVLVAGLGYVFATQGGKIQEIVLSKSGTRYIRSATIIDIIYAFILWFFKEYNNIPMSTTWVFVGLLCGRELAVYHLHDANKRLKSIFPLLLKDLFKVFVGLAVSVALALLVAGAK